MSSFQWKQVYRPNRQEQTRPSRGDGQVVAAPLASTCALGRQISDMRWAQSRSPFATASAAFSHSSGPGLPNAFQTQCWNRV